MSRSEATPSAPRVTAVITAFNPGPNLVESCRILTSQVADIVVVDDGSPLPVAPVLDACAELGCTVIRLDDNVGIAAALNRGVRAALRNEQTAFVLTLDQDSLLQDDYVARAIRASENAIAAGVNIGMVAPERVEGLPSRVANARGGVLFGHEPIQSGLVIPRTVLEKHGLFREELFIDSVDTEFFMRLTDAGLATVLAAGTVLAHSLGERYYPTILGHRMRWAGQDIGVTRSAPFRYYYIARNRVLMNRAFARRHRLWTLQQTALDARHFALVLALVPGRRVRARMIARGWTDGVRGRSGRIPDGAARIGRR